MDRKWISVGAAVLILICLPCARSATSGISFHDYVAAVDDVSGEVLSFGEMVTHSGYDVQLRETIKNVPILSIQYAGRLYREGPRNEPNHVEARATAVTERLLHAWTLMDYGAKLEIAEDTWDAGKGPGGSRRPGHPAIFVRSPVAGTEPLRIITIFPQDLSAFPWVSSEQSFAEYVAALIHAHYLLFWKHESDILAYEALRIDKTREGKIFKEIAVRAVEMARLKEQSGFDQDILKDVLARLTLSQREALYRLATVAPVDWESSSSPE
jgi:hypothetical protein